MAQVAFSSLMQRGLNKSVLTRYLAVGARSGASIADQGATAAISFLASILIGRELGTEALGVYAITNVLVTLVRTLQDCLVLEPMAVFGPRQTAEERPRYFGFLLGLETIWVGLLTTLIAAGSAIAWAAGGIEPDLFHTIAASCVFSFIFCFLYFRRRQFYVELRQFRALAQSLWYLLLVVGAFAALLFVDGWSVVHVYVLLSACSATACIAGRDRVNHRFSRPSTAEIRRYAGDHWSFGKWVLLAAPLGMATYHGYFWVMGALVSTEAAGLLKAAEALVAPFFQVAMGLGLMLIPMAAREVDRMSPSQQWDYAIRLLLPLLGVAAVYGIAVYLGGEFALRALFGGGIEAAFPLVEIMAVIPFFVVAPLPAAVVLSALRRANMRFISQCIACAGTLLVGLPLVYQYGLMGGAVALVVTEVLFAVGQWGCLFWLLHRGSKAEPAQALRQS
ncbi:MAG: hypothetical protein U0S49_05705 [Rhodospirillales bacterium]|nr:hypothetical protein [Rhodospirillales bacterium]